MGPRIANNRALSRTLSFYSNLDVEISHKHVVAVIEPILGDKLTQVRKTIPVDYLDV